MGPQVQSYDPCFYAQSVYICTIIAYLYSLCANKSDHNGFGPQVQSDYDLCFYAQSVYICTIIAYLYTLCAHKSGQNSGPGAPKAKLLQILTMNVGEAIFKKK